MLGGIGGRRRRGQQRMRWLDGPESEWNLGVDDGQGGLACCDSWGCKESDTTERLNWTEDKEGKRCIQGWKSYMFRLITFSRPVSTDYQTSVYYFSKDQESWIQWERRIRLPGKTGFGDSIVKVLVRVLWQPTRNPQQLSGRKRRRQWLRLPKGKDSLVRSYVSTCSKCLWMGIIAEFIIPEWQGQT